MSVCLDMLPLLPSHRAHDLSVRAPVSLLVFLCLFLACSSCHNVDGRKLHASQLNVFSRSYPTILYFRAGGEEPVAYKGKRNVEAFKEFVEATRTGAQNTNTQ
jgi:hypothetical protein